MKKYSLYLLPLALILFCLCSCEPGDQEIKTLNRKDGTWEIVSMHYEYYDSVGTNVISDSTVHDLGELIFFKSQTTDALWSGYLVTAAMNQSNGTIAAYTGYIFIDGKRVFMQDDNGGGPLPGQFLGLWTVNKDTHKNQEWSNYTLSSSNALYCKTTITLKKK